MAASVVTPAGSSVRHGDNNLETYPRNAIITCGMHDADGVNLGGQRVVVHGSSLLPVGVIVSTPTGVDWRDFQVVGLSVTVMRMPA